MSYLVVINTLTQRQVIKHRTMLTDELRYRLLKALEYNPNLSQRAIAKELGISLGKVNFCLNALLDVGWVKAQNFKNSDNRLKYAYVLTPQGIEEKAKVTSRFLLRKLEEHVEIEAEIEQIRKELNESKNCEAVS